MCVAKLVVRSYTGSNLYGIFHANHNYVCVAAADAALVAAVSRLQAVRAVQKQNRSGHTNGV